MDAGDAPPDELGRSETVSDNLGRNAFVLGGGSHATEVLTDASGRLQFVLSATERFTVLNGAAGSGNTYKFGDGTTLSYDRVVGTMSATATVGTDAGGSVHHLGGKNGDAISTAAIGATVSGGRGNDTLSGSGGGSHTYLYNLGDGSDLLADTSAKTNALGAATPNRIVFGAGIAASDLRLSGGAGALRLTVGADANDNIIFGNFDHSSATELSPIDNFVFADGTVLTYSQLIARGFDGGPGNDIMSGTASDDRMSGFGGDDILIGQSGNDTLDGGAGNDTLRGGGGSDVYLFATGSGQDVIDNRDAAAGQVDTLRLVGLNPADVSLAANGFDLVLKLRNSSDQVVVANHFASGSALNRIEFAGGVLWSEADINANLAVNLTEGADNVVGTPGNDVFSALGGNDSVLGMAGNDVIDGGTGNDTLLGGDGADSL